ncbi:10724_t:CDS:2, partial [Funneliformis geosporum]
VDNELFRLISCCDVVMTISEGWSTSEHDRSSTTRPRTLLRLLKPTFTITSKNYLTVKPFKAERAISRCSSDPVATIVPKDL